MDSHPYDVLSLEQGGGLIFTPCPGTKGVDVRASVAQLEQAGAQAVISLTPDDEMKRLGVEVLPQACAEQGLSWLHLPVEDDAAPAAEFEQRWQEDRESVHRILDQGGAVAIHCKGGSGRTGLMAAIILMERGHGHETVVSMVQGLRPKSLRLRPHREYLAAVSGNSKEGNHR